MPETERLGYSRGVMEQLRASHEQLSPEELLDLVCHLTKTYVLDRTLPFALPHPNREQEIRQDRPDAPLTRAETADEAKTNDPPEVRFARLIENLKVRTGLPQLSGFKVEGDRAVLVVDNQKITFGERVTVEFMPRQQNPTAPPAPSSPSASAPRRSPGAPEPRSERPQPGAPAPAPSPEPKAAPPTPPTSSADDGDDGYDPSVERFKRLDLD